MPRYTININAAEAADLALTGGKGANLAKLSQLADIVVPEGFIITTEAYKAFIKPFSGDKNTIRTLATPRAFDDELRESLAANGERGLYAVRSSATAEDLPDASFAGQQDSFINVQGFENVKQAVLDCFASLFNERALSYRKKNGFDNDTVSMAVIVQKMVQADFSGVMFTADPMTSDRFTTVIETIAGLGEELVSGRKIPTTYKIRGCEVDTKGAELLSKEQLSVLAADGKTIEKACGAPQDIEWCIDDGKIYVVQSRPITTLYPLPQTTDELKRVYLSFGHQQMMTDVILPLGMSFLRFLFGMIDLLEIGGRPYVELTHDVKNPFNRFMLRQKFGLMDEHMLAALDDVFSRKDYIKSTPRGVTMMSKAMRMNVPFIGFFKETLRMNFNRSTDCIREYFDRQWKSVSDFEAKLSELKGVDAIDLIESDSKKFDFLYDLTAMGATILIAYSIQKHINKYGLKLLGEDNYVNKLAKSVDNNITSEMGLALCDVADVFRDTPSTFAYLEQSGENFSLDELREINGAAAAAFDKFLQVYGARCAGEIDITKTRFIENPAILSATLLSNIKNYKKGQLREEFAAGKHTAQEDADRLLAAVETRYGKRKARKLASDIKFYRDFVGLREAPKFFWIRRFWSYKKVLIEIADDLVKNGVIDAKDDIYYLYIDELRTAIATHKTDKQAIADRRENYKHWQTLNPPRVIFSDGEVPQPMRKINANIPANALEGQSVSPGVVEGRARVITSIAEAKLEKGDILVTKFTDPSWTPVFLTIKGLVTEIGGMMTHGAVITREYGLPAVVGVMDATRLIKDGDIIRINGNDGYVEVLR